jgi:hypothetical protein
MIGVSGVNCVQKRRVSAHPAPLASTRTILVEFAADNLGRACVRAVAVIAYRAGGGNDAAVGGQREEENKSNDGAGVQRSTFAAPPSASAAPVPSVMPEST